MLVVLLLGAWTGLEGCGSGRRSAAGAACELTSECDTPLVCRLAHCRNECATSGDCAAGLSCVLDARGLGACQLPDERDCVLASDCAAPLVCRFRQCVNECAEDRDCLGGARCTPAPEGGGVCIDVSTTSCVSDGECRAALPNTFCLGGRCREECHSDRDCRNDWWCDEPVGACFPPPRPETDAGSIDGGGVDGGGVDGGAVDGGAVDGGAVDGGAMDGGATDGSVPMDAGPLDAGPLDAPQPDAGLFDAGGASATDAGRAPPPSTCLGGPLRSVLSFDVGRQHACAIVDDGTRRLFCWGVGTGYNFGVVGANLAECATEITSLRGADMVEVAVSASATCVRSSLGEVRCFGDNTYGELGRGTSGSPTSDVTPAPIPGLVARSLWSGLGLYFCATRGGMPPQCWGDDSVLQLGDPPFCGCVRPSPVDAVSAAGANALYLGYAHTCYVTGTGGVACFGDAGGADLNGGVSIVGARAVAGGQAHVCVLTASGVECWGQNAQGQLGDGTTSASAVPVSVLGLPSVPVGISAGDYHSCAVLGTGDVYCWGAGGGVNATTHSGTYPMATYVMSGASAVRCGYNYTCALVGDRVRCLGGSITLLGYGTGLAPSVSVEVRLP